MYQYLHFDSFRYKISILYALPHIPITEHAQVIIKGAFHLVTQVDTNIILSFLTFNKKRRQNDTYVDLCHQMEST